MPDRQHPVKISGYDLRLTVETDVSWQIRLDQVTADTQGGRHHKAREIAQSFITLCQTAQWPEAGHAFLTTCVRDDVCGQTLVNLYEAAELRLAVLADLLIGINTGLLTLAQLSKGNRQRLPFEYLSELTDRLCNRLDGFARLHAIAEFHDSNVRQGLSWPTRPEPRHHTKTKNDFPSGLKSAKRKLREENPAFH